MLDYYLAISQMSLGKLITATLGIALIRMTHKVVVEENISREYRDAFSEHDIRIYTV